MHIHVNRPQRHVVGPPARVHHRPGHRVAGDHHVEDDGPAVRRKLGRQMVAFRAVSVDECQPLPFCSINNGVNRQPDAWTYPAAELPLRSNRIRQANPTMRVYPSQAFDLRESPQHEAARTLHVMAAELHPESTCISAHGFKTPFRISSIRRFTTGSLTAIRSAWSPKFEPMPTTLRRNRPCFRDLFTTVAASGSSGER
jgi:hypothetical protein